jgi:glutathione S-transferase
VLVEAQLAWYGLPYEIENLDDLFKSTEARERLRPVNPLAQVPTLVLPDGQVLTESAAITLHLVDVTQSADLVPAPGEGERPTFLRWLVFLVANVYPTFTFADDPARFVEGEAAQQVFETNVGAYRERLWRQPVQVSSFGTAFSQRARRHSQHFNLQRRLVRVRRSGFPSRGAEPMAQCGRGQVIMHSTLGLVCSPQVKLTKPNPLMLPLMWT